MKRANRLRRAVPSLVLVMAVLVMAGHVCALPLDALAFAHRDDSGGSPEHGDDHLASCEVVAGKTQVAPVADLSWTPLNPVTMVLEPRTRPETSAASSDRQRERPPLFLLHGSLLI